MLISTRKKALILRLKDPERVLSVIPKARKFTHKGKEYVAVPHRRDEVKVLNNIGIDAPSPMLYYYDWPGRFKPFEAQRTTGAFMAMHNRCFNLNDLGCVDSETEYLSPVGWVKISEYREGLVGQYVPETGAVEFVAPQEYVKKPCHDMFHIKTKYGLDQMLSPEHRVLLVSKESKCKQEVVQAARLFQRQEQWVATGRNNKSREHIGWAKAAIPVTYSVAGGVGVALTDAELRVQIAVIADGHFSNGTNRCVVRLKKLRKIERLRELLTLAALPYAEREQNCATAQGYAVFSFQAPLRVKEFGPAFWAASNEQLAVVRDEVIHWDGCFRENKPTREFISNSKLSADFVQYAFNTGGFTARIVVDKRGPTYSVLIRDNGKPLQVGSSGKNGRNRVMTPTASTDGFKYCFMVPSSFLIFRRNGCVFASGNTGKTLATLWAYDYLRSVGTVNKVLVVSPLSTLERAWGDEIFNHFSHLTTAVLYGSREKRLKMLEIDADIYIINHDGLKVSGMVEAINARPDIDLIIIDEISQAARTASSDRWKSLAKVVRHEAEKGRQRLAWGLTGTPIPNNPTDAWAQCRLLVPEKVPPYFNSFKGQVMKQIGTFTWIPRKEAQEVVFEAMQPAIRFKRDEVVDLPPCMFQERTVELTTAQKKAYKEMLNKLQAEFESGEVTAVNEAVKAQKLIQILCIGYNTPVLTELGWVPIQEVPSNVRVWDGVEWVAHRGLAYKGVKRVIKCDGVYMTPDHEVLTESGWKPAGEVVYGQTREGLDRVAVRLPDGDTARRVYNPHGGEFETSDVAVSMRLWERGRSGQPVPSYEVPFYAKELRLPPRERQAQDVVPPNAQYVEWYEAAVLKPARQGLEKLRRTWDYGMRALGQLVRQLSGGYGFELATGPDAGSSRRERPVLAGELPVGYSQAAGEQQAGQCCSGYSRRGDDAYASGGAIRVESDNAVCANQPVQVARGESVLDTGIREVFDLIDCGPRNRFAVRGENGELLIVHNCGAVYGKNGEEHYIDAKPRFEAVREVCEESGSKTIVFVPFVSMVAPLAKYLEDAGFSTACIHGGVSKNDRDTIFSSFQKLNDPQVIVSIAAAMSHGLTLTAASTIVWAAPITNNDTFEQANARISRPGAKLNQLIVMIEGSPIERKYYQRLKEKGRVQGVLLQLVQGSREAAKCAL